MRIKVCGITKAEQAYQLDEMGIEFAGFIFYARSPRYVYKSMSASTIKNIKGNINKVGVFVNAGIDEVLRTVDECGLYLVQLHGNESQKYCETIANYISVIKVFHLSEEENVMWKIKDYYEVADLFMFDTSSVTNNKEELLGGTGKKFNWNLLKGLSIEKPFLLSGGIGPDDANTLQDFLKDKVAKDLFAIDINSRFEITPGIKNISLIQSFAAKVKNL